MLYVLANGCLIFEESKDQSGNQRNAANIAAQMHKKRLSWFLDSLFFMLALTVPKLFPAK
jgi:hypothetical protein